MMERLFRTLLVRLPLIALVAAFLIAGASCAFHPRGESEERERAAGASQGLALAGEPPGGDTLKHTAPAPSAQIAPLAPSASLKEILDYAYAANQDLHKMYWEWIAAIEAVPQEASPGTNLAVSVESMFEEGETSLERTILGVGTDPMSGLPWPGKLSAGGKRALEMARAAGFRFFKTRLELRAKVLTAYYDYALTAEMIRLKSAEVPLWHMTAGALAAGVEAGATSTAELLEAQTGGDLAASELATLKSRATGQAAMINALLGREPLAPLDPPSVIPKPRSLPYSDAEILALVAEKNPELQALASEAEARTQTVSLARQQYIPDLGLTLSGDLAGMTKSVMAMLTTPILRAEAIRASIRQARAELEASRALRRQTESDLKAQTVLMLYDLRNAERQAELLSTVIIPRLDQAIETERASYQAGRTSLADLLSTQRMLLDIRAMLADMRIERERLLAGIEELAGREPEVTGGTESQRGSD